MIKRIARIDRPDTLRAGPVAFSFTWSSKPCVAWHWLERSPHAPPGSRQHHEIVDGPQIPRRGDIDAGLGKLVGIGLAFVPQHVVLVGDNQCRRQALELLERGLKRRCGRLYARRLIRQILGSRTTSSPLGSGSRPLRLAVTAFASMTCLIVPTW